MYVEIIIYCILLFLSLYFLWFAGDKSVKYSIKTAANFKLTSLFVGFALIAISTGLPELAIVIISIFEKTHGISTGTILGSNVCDISLVLGLAVLLGGNIIIKKKEAKDSLLTLLVTAVSMAIVFILGTLSWIEGLILICVYFGSIWWLWKNSTKKEIQEEKTGQKKAVKDHDSFFKTKWGILLKLLGSIFLILVFTEFAVRFAIKLTNLLKLSIETVGATVFAIGTSLPEISVSLNAVKKKEYSLALGNALGSVLEQGTLLLGLLAIGYHKAVDIKPLRSLIPFMFIPFAIIAFGIIKRKKIAKIEALLMFTIFIIFMLFQIFWIR
ncbi:hypothetical protein GF322_03985 [Candidatus Dependentiae bacterium]|nr:hypothetical protein [Candidatus Dependentiae bacterium]